MNLWPLETKPCYLLVPRSMFYEFIPLDHSHEEQPKVKYCLILFIQFLNVQQHIEEGQSDNLKEGGDYERVIFVEHEQFRR